MLIVLQLIYTRNVSKFEIRIPQPTLQKLATKASNLLTKRSTALDMTPRWMKNLHFYDLEHEHQKFINDLNTRCQATKMPFMTGDMPDDFVSRPDITEKAISFLVDEQKEGGEPIPSTVVLHGAGGFGKTTLLKAICHNEKTRCPLDHHRSASNRLAFNSGRPD
jgi:hypothetical protein